MEAKIEKVEVVWSDGLVEIIDIPECISKLEIDVSKRRSVL